MEEGEEEYCDGWIEMEDAGSTLTEQIGPLLQVEWGQGYPYNKFCPDSGCTNYYGHVPAGCVAVATAQIMSYHQYS
jgi:hypothetical protein